MTVYESVIDAMTETRAMNKIPREMYEKLQARGFGSLTRTSTSVSLAPGSAGTTYEAHPTLVRFHVQLTVGECELIERTPGLAQALVTVITLTDPDPDAALRSLSALLLAHAREVPGAQSGFISMLEFRAGEWRP